jgi:pre-rRNA-processing protein IPI3
VCLVGRDYLISGQPGKPLLNVWQVNKAEQLPLRLFTPGPVSALAVSPSGSYLAAAVQEAVTVWQLGTGCLMAVLSRHYQPVTVLAFTRDGSHLISGGEDGQVQCVCSAVQCSAVQCSAVQCSAVQCRCWSGPW